MGWFSLNSRSLEVTSHSVATVCDPHLQTYSDALEQIQKRAARFVTNDYKSKTPGQNDRNAKEPGLEHLPTEKKGSNVRHALPHSA